jgi:hypothetical protein
MSTVTQRLLVLLLSLRAAVATCLLRARTAVSEAHQQIDEQLSNWYSDAASRRTFRPDVASVAAVGALETVSTGGGGGGDDAGRGVHRHGSLGDIKALKAASRGLQDENRALLATLVYRTAKLGRQSAMLECELSVEFGGYWNRSRSGADRFISQLSSILEQLYQEVASLKADLEDAHILNAQKSVSLGSDDQSNVMRNSSATASGGGSSGAATVRFQAGLVDIYHAAHKLSSRALLFHGMVCNPTGGGNSKLPSAADATTNATTEGSIDLGSIVALKQQASSMIDGMRLDLQTCTSLVDASDRALTDLISRLDVGTSDRDSDDCDTSGNSQPSTLGLRTDLFIESDPGPLPVTTEIFECEVETLSSGIDDDTSKHTLTAEQQREIRKARMAARQLEREARLKQEAEAEKAAATARSFYDELQAVVGSRDI